MVRKVVINSFQRIERLLYRKTREPEERPPPPGKKTAVERRASIL